MYTSDRDAYRQAFFHTWQKFLKKQPLDAQETQLVAIILEHPEYQKLLVDTNTHIKQEYALEENPFIHMSLHLSIRDQIQLDKPCGIKECFENLMGKYANRLVVEHMIMNCLATILKESYTEGVAPDEQKYLKSVKELIG